MSKDARKRLARAKAAGLKTMNFRRRGLEAAGALEARASGKSILGIVADKLRTLATNIRREMGT